MNTTLMLMRECISLRPNETVVGEHRGARFAKEHQLGRDFTTTPSF
jgi:hypothetical protein